MALFPPWNPLQNINARVRPFQKVQAHHKNKPLSTEISWISLSTLKILRLFKSNSWFYFFSSHLFFYMKMSLPIFNLVGTDHLNAFQHNHWKEKSWSFFLNYNKKVFLSRCSSHFLHYSFTIILLQNINEIEEAFVDHYKNGVNFSPPHKQTNHCEHESQRFLNNY